MAKLRRVLGSNRNRLDEVLSEYQGPQLKVLDKNLKPEDGLKITDTEFEPKARRDIYIINNTRDKDQRAYFVHYDEATRLSLDEIRTRRAINLINVGDNGFLYDQSTSNIYNRQGYIVVDQKDIFKVDGKFYYQNKNESVLDFSQKTEYLAGTNLYSIGNDLYEKKGGLYVNYPARDKYYNEAGLSLTPLKNEAVKTSYPVTQWSENQILVDFEPNHLNPIDSERAFHIQMVAPHLAHQKSMEVTLISYDPVTNQPVDQVKVALQRDKAAKTPGTFRSEPLALVAYRENLRNDALSDQLQAGVGSVVAVSYPTLGGETAVIPISSVRPQKVLEVNVVTVKNGEEGANLKMAEVQLDSLRKALAASGVAVKVNHISLEESPELDAALESPEKTAAFAAKQSSNPNSIKMMVGLGHEDKYLTAGNSNLPKGAENSLFLGKNSRSYDAVNIVLPMLLVSTGYLKPNEAEDYNKWQLTKDRVKFLHESPLLVDPAKPKVVIDPFAPKPALVH